MGWLRLVGCLKIQVSLQNTGLFCRALLQKRPILSILLIVATPHQSAVIDDLCVCRDREGEGEHVCTSCLLCECIFHTCEAAGVWCVCVYMYVYVYIYILHIHTHTRVRVHVYRYMSQPSNAPRVLHVEGSVVYIHICLHKVSHTYICIYIYIYIYKCVHIYTHIFIYVCNIHIYVYTYFYLSFIYTYYHGCVRVHIYTCASASYRVAKTHRIPYLYSSFSAKEPYI